MAVQSDFTFHGSIDMNGLKKGDFAMRGDVGKSFIVIITQDEITTESVTFSATIVCTEKECEYSIGDTSNSWMKRYFKPFYGNISINVK